MKDRLNPAELDIELELELGALWLTGLPAEVEAPVPLSVEETSVMIGEGIPVAVRLTDVEVLADEDDVLKGPAEPAVRVVAPYERIVAPAEPDVELPEELESVNWYPLEEALVTLVLLPVEADDEDGDTLTD